MRNKTRAMIQTVGIVMAAVALGWLIHFIFNLLSQSDILLAIAGLVVVWWIWVVYKINLAYINITQVLAEEDKKLKL